MNGQHHILAELFQRVHIKGFILSLLEVKIAMHRSLESVSANNIVTVEISPARFLLERRQSELA